MRPNPAYEIANKWLLEIECKYQGVTVPNHIIMPNHVHFILLINSTADAHIGATPSETVKSSGAHIGAPLHEIIKWYKTQTTNEYIRLVKEGILPPFNIHIWQRGYYEHIIRSEKDYLSVWQYIDDNPSKWSEDEYYMMS